MGHSSFHLTKSSCWIEWMKQWWPSALLHPAFLSIFLTLKPSVLCTLSMSPCQLSCFSGGSVLKNPSAMQGSIPESGRTPGVGNGNLLYSYQGNPMDRGAWRLQSMGLQSQHDWATTYTHTHALSANKWTFSALYRPTYISVAKPV